MNDKVLPSEPHHRPDHYQVTFAACRLSLISPFASCHIKSQQPRLRQWDEVAAIRRLKIVCSNKRRQGGRGKQTWEMWTGREWCWGAGWVFVHTETTMSDFHEINSSEISITSSLSFFLTHQDLRRSFRRQLITTWLWKGKVTICMKSFATDVSSPCPHLSRLL